MADENFYLKKAIDLPEYTGDIDDVDFIAVKTNDGYMKRVKTSTTIATKADKVTDATAGDVVTLDSNGNIEDSGVALDQLAKIDGSYASMAVGVADNLAGRGTVSAKYTFRTSGGSEDIGTGTATIDTYKGNTIVWNQLVDTDTTSVTPISGHKYYTLISGTASIITSDGTAISVTGGADMVIDLTLMFGAGNEPSTAAEFQALYPLDWYDFNAGELVNNTASAIKTVGFNQWDEQWELGFISAAGIPTPSNNSIRSKNLMPCFPSTEYFIMTTGTYPYGVSLKFYDGENNFITGTDTNQTNTVVTSPSNAKWFGLSVYDGTSTYNNDICINLSWSGYRNGEYEPYSETTTYINGSNGSLATLTGKLNGEGESVTVFADGMRGAGTAYDKVKGTTADKVMSDEIDLGDLTWTYGGDYFVSAALTSAKASSINLVCSKYPAANKLETLVTGMEDKVCGVDSSRHLLVRDSAYTDAATFKTAMAGVKAIYEMDTPQSYTLDTTPATQYPVNDFGTEQALPASTASAVVAPILYDVKYAMNAVDQIRRLPVNYISKESFENFCTELATKLGTALNSTITITATYDSTDEEYDYSISIVANE